jgi:hypothetical protein
LSLLKMIDICYASQFKQLFQQKLSL